MKIFCTSDIHGRYNNLRKTIDFINSRENIDVAVFCGDISASHEYSTVMELVKIQEEDYLCFKTMISEIKNKKVLYILGNHDLFLVDKDDMNYLPNAISANIENTFIPFEILDIQLYGSNREGNELDIKKALDEICNINKEKIIVAHQPPYMCLDKGTNGHYYGSSSIKNMIFDKGPAIFLCGHVHEDYGVKKLGNTLVVNCACEEFINRGMIVDTTTLECKKVTLK
ncbi:metallophosphoesterase [Clostridium algoriphilum]|uniref:metallophosphoesterase family protein n=1 Tax=Clostridium algoriphilum TaxID=198347 RepID=UPI001CF3451C|nr:metallophosphoesterase [Clostridium algoriphilum]MCB2292854.1 metallophosphoesterase [Clostridium algoriphilum]